MVELDQTFALADAPVVGASATEFEADPRRVKNLAA